MLAVILSMVFLCNTTLYACPVSEDTLRLPLGTAKSTQLQGTRGADIGFITRIQHAFLRIWLEKNKAPSSQNSRPDLAEGLRNEGYENVKEVYAVPDLFKVTGIPDHYAIRDGVLYVDRKILEGEDGIAYLMHIADEFEFILHFARTDPKFARIKNEVERRQALVGWLDEEGSSEEIERLLNEYHGLAEELPEGAEVMLAEIPVIRAKQDEIADLESEIEKLAEQVVAEQEEADRESREDERREPRLEKLYLIGDMLEKEEKLKETRRELAAMIRPVRGAAGHGEEGVIDAECPDEAAIVAAIQGSDYNFLKQAVPLLLQATRQILSADNTDRSDFERAHNLIEQLYDILRILRAVAFESSEVLRWVEETAILNSTLANLVKTLNMPLKQVTEDYARSTSVECTSEEFWSGLRSHLLNYLISQGYLRENADRFIKEDCLWGAKRAEEALEVLGYAPEIRVEDGHWWVEFVESSEVHTISYLHLEGSKPVAEQLRAQIEAEFSRIEELLNTGPGIELLMGDIHRMIERAIGICLELDDAEGIYSNRVKALTAKLNRQIEAQGGLELAGFSTTPAIEATSAIDETSLAQASGGEGQVILDAVREAEDIYIQETRQVNSNDISFLALHNLVERSLVNPIFISICQDVSGRLDRIVTEEDLIEAANDILHDMSDARVLGVASITGEVSSVKIVSIFRQAFQHIVFSLELTIEEPADFIAEKEGITNALYTVIVLTRAWRQFHPPATEESTQAGGGEGQQPLATDGTSSLQIAVSSLSITEASIQPHLMHRFENSIEELKLKKGVPNAAFVIFDALGDYIKRVTLTDREMEIVITALEKIKEKTGYLQTIKALNQLFLRLLKEYAERTGCTIIFDIGSLHGQGLSGLTENTNAMVVGFVKRQGNLLRALYQGKTAENVFILNLAFAQDQDLSVPEGMADEVVCSFPGPEIAENFEDVIAEIIRVSKGKAVLRVLTEVREEGPFANRFIDSIKRLEYKPEETDFLTLLRQALQQYGFDIETFSLVELDIVKTKHNWPNTRYLQAFTGAKFWRGDDVFLTLVIARTPATALPQASGGGRLTVTEPLIVASEGKLVSLEDMGFQISSGRERSREHLARIMMRRVDEALAHAEEKSYSYLGYYTVRLGGEGIGWGKPLDIAIEYAIENAFQHNNGKVEDKPIGGKAFYDNGELVIQVIGGGKTGLRVGRDDIFWATGGLPQEPISFSRQEFAGEALGTMFYHLETLIGGSIAPDQDIAVRWYHLDERLAEHKDDPYNPVITEIRIPLQDVEILMATAVPSPEPLHAASEEERQAVESHLAEDIPEQVAKEEIRQAARGKGELAATKSTVFEPGPTSVEFWQDAYTAMNSNDRVLYEAGKVQTDMCLPWVGGAYAIAYNVLQERGDIVDLRIVNHTWVELEGRRNPTHFWIEFQMSDGKWYLACGTFKQYPQFQQAVEQVVVFPLDSIPESYRWLFVGSDDMDSRFHYYKGSVYDGSPDLRAMADLVIDLARRLQDTTSAEDTREIAEGRAASAQAGGGGEQVATELAEILQIKLKGILDDIGSLTYWMSPNLFSHFAPVVVKYGLSSAEDARRQKESLQRERKKIERTLRALEVLSEPNAIFRLDGVPVDVEGLRVLIEEGKLDFPIAVLTSEDGRTTYFFDTRPELAPLSIGCYSQELQRVIVKELSRGERRIFDIIHNNLGDTLTVDILVERTRLVDVDVRGYIVGLAFELGLGMRWNLPYAERIVAIQKYLLSQQAVAAEEAMTALENPDNFRIVEAAISTLLAGAAIGVSDIPLEELTRRKYELDKLMAELRVILSSSSTSQPERDTGLLYGRLKGLRDAVDIKLARIGHLKDAVDTAETELEAAREKAAKEIAEIGDAGGARHFSRRSKRTEKDNKIPELMGALHRAEQAYRNATRYRQIDSEGRKAGYVMAISHLREIIEQKKQQAEGQEHRPPELEREREEHLIVDVYAKPHRRHPIIDRLIKGEAIDVVINNLREVEVREILEALLDDIAELRVLTKASGGFTYSHPILDSYGISTRGEVELLCRQLLGIRSVVGSELIKRKHLREAVDRAREELALARTKAEREIDTLTLERAKLRGRKVREIYERHRIPDLELALHRAVEAYRNPARQTGAEDDYDWVRETIVVLKNVVAFSAEYALEHGVNVETGQRAVIITTDPLQEERLMNKPEIRERLGYDIFIIRLERGAEAEIQWNALYYGVPYDFNTMTIEEIINNRNLIEVLIGV